MDSGSVGVNGHRASVGSGYQQRCSADRQSYRRDSDPLRRRSGNRKKSKKETRTRQAAIFALLFAAFEYPLIFTYFLYYSKNAAVMQEFFSAITKPLSAITKPLKAHPLEAPLCIQLPRWNLRRCLSRSGANRRIGIRCRQSGRSRADGTFPGIAARRSFEA